METNSHESALVTPSPMMKHMVWSDLVCNSPLPEDMLRPSHVLRKVQLALEDDRDFWRLFLGRGELRTKTVAELDPIKREKVTRHFVEVCIRTAVALGWWADTKPPPLAPGSA